VRFEGRDWVVVVSCGECGECRVITEELHVGCEQRICHFGPDCLKRAMVGMVPEVTMMVVNRY
jgi:hypothetical protein